MKSKHKWYRKVLYWFFMWVLLGLPIFLYFAITDFDRMFYLENVKNNDPIDHKYCYFNHNDTLYYVLGFYSRSDLENVKNVYQNGESVKSQEWDKDYSIFKKVEGKKLTIVKYVDDLAVIRYEEKPRPGYDHVKAVFVPKFCLYDSVDTSLVISESDWLPDSWNLNHHSGTTVSFEE